MGTQAWAWAEHVLSAGEVRNLPERLVRELGEDWGWEVLPYWVSGPMTRRDASGRWVPHDGPPIVDEVDAGLNGPQELLLLRPTLLGMSSHHRWRGLLSLQHLREETRLRAHRVARVLRVSELAWVPDHAGSLGDFDDLAQFKEYLRREYGPPGDVATVTPELAAAVQAERVLTWFVERVPPD